MAINPTHRRALHPAVSILSWLIYALAVEWASESVLVLITVLTAIVYGTQRDAVPAFLRLLRRSRWLLLSLGLLYAWTVNGVWIWPALGGLSPTLEGLTMGGERILRLMLLLAALALLLHRLSSGDLVYGLYLLTKPFAKIGFDRRAFAVRLALAMEWARSRDTVKKWRMMDGLELAMSQTESGPEEICFESQDLAWPDGLALAAMIALLGVSV
jgi:energy-coupling factor transporter transmembrane protein EcfT